VTIDVCRELDESWAKYSVDFIKSRKGTSRPFFLQHSTRGAHFDNYPNKKFIGKSPAKYPYKDALIELDDILGRLVQALKESGELDNTLIFITSDNGPEMESWPDSAYTPFRCAKGSTWEGGVRVPGIAYWSGMISPGRTSDGLFDLADLFSSALKLAGAWNRVPKDRYIDGIDQTSFLLTDQGLSNRKFVYYWLQNVFSAVRCAEYKWMWAATSTDPNDAVTPGGFSGDLAELCYGKAFNLYLDPKETHSYMIRKLVYNATMLGARSAHIATFKTYPPKVPIRVT
jgi:arylsulfatase